MVQGSLILDATWSTATCTTVAPSACAAAGDSALAISNAAAHTLLRRIKLNKATSLLEIRNPITHVSCHVQTRRESLYECPRPVAEERAPTRGLDGSPTVSGYPSGPEC